MSNIIDDVLEWSPRLALSGMMEKQQTVVNATEPNNISADGGKTNTENSDQSGDEIYGKIDDMDQPQHKDHM